MLTISKIGTKKKNELPVTKIKVTKNFVLKDFKKTCIL
jgi:hypothetical protein